MTTVKIVKVGNSYMATIPRWFMKELRWLRGDPLEVNVEGRSLVLTGMVTHPVSIAPDVHPQYGEVRAGEEPEE